MDILLGRKGDTMQQPAGAIFDMDGTLLDSMFYWNQAPEDCLRQIYHKEPTADLMEHLKPLTIEEGGAWMKKAYGLSDSGAQIAAQINLLVKRFYTERVLVKPGAAAWLEAFTRAGIPMAIATSTDRDLVEAALARTGLGKYFGAVFTCTEVGAGKGKPDVYEAAARFLGTPHSTTWVFEDSLFAMRTAKAAGFPVAAVYDASQDTLQQEIRALADWYLPSFDAVEPPQWD